MCIKISRSRLGLLSLHLLYNDVSFMLSYLYTADPPMLQEICRSRVDIAFIIDASSASQSNNDYGRKKDFVKTIASTLDIAEGGSHAGIVLFSRDGEVAMKFSDSNNQSEFLMAVDKLPLLGGTRRRIDKALKLAFDTLLKPESGMREDVPQVVLLITNGGQTQEGGTGAVTLSQAVVPFHESNIKVLVVGIGPGIKQDELQSIVKSKQDLYIAGNFDMLASNEFSRRVSKAVCIRGGFSFFFIHSLLTCLIF